MPWLGRQCRTTVSPGLTVVTPGPISITRAEASWPSRCGRNLSGPLTASISLICAPHIEVNSTFTSTWPASSASGSVISSRTSGLRDSARIAALLFMICMYGPLFEIDEFVVAGVAEVIEQPDPGSGIEECFAGQRPALQIELLELVAITLDHNVLVLAHPFDLLQRRLQVEDAQIVQASERDDEIEVFIAERISILRAIAKQMGAHLGLGI